jgi:small subunit ribosomal protein S1
MPNQLAMKEPPTTSAMEELLKTDDLFSKIPEVGDLVEGVVISVSKSEVILDIDGLTTGVIRGGELFDESGRYSDLKIGDRAYATVLELENEKGQMELSFRIAGHQQAWEELDEMLGEGRIVEASIVDANKGGLIVRVGRVEGFLPVSQLTMEHYPRVEGGDKNKILERLKTYMTKKFSVKIIDVDEAEDKLIVSEKAAWEEEQASLLSKYKVGDHVKGRVTGVVDFGAFVEFAPGLEGLVHISELAWQRIDHPRDVIHVGDNVEAEIIQIDGSKISLSMKKLKQDPWASVRDRYQVGQTVQGRVLKVNPFGAFVELDPDIHGLAHISELSDKLVSDPNDLLKVGEMVDFKILTIEPREHRLGLSMKALRKKEKETPAPEESLESEKPTADAEEEIKQEAAPSVPAEEPVKSE